jgi:hypothetical protein
MHGRGRSLRHLSTLVLAAGLIACAAARRDPERSLAAPPAYGRGVASASLQPGPVGAQAADRPSLLVLEPAQDEACVEFWPEVRFRNYAYDHIVHLFSRCDVRALCAVSSDVNPEAIEVEAGRGEHVEVFTARGSPAHEFMPRVACRFAPT